MPRKARVQSIQGQTLGNGPTMQPGYSGTTADSNRKGRTRKFGTTQTSTLGTRKFNADKLVSTFQAMGWISQNVNPRHVAQVIDLAINPY
jgi:hypothetical protein